MAVRALARLALVSVAAGGVLALAGHLDHAEPTPATAPSATRLTVTGLTVTGLTVKGTVRAPAPLAALDAMSGTAPARLERALRPAPGRSATSVRQGPAAGFEPVDESLPHTHAIDPEAGGPVPVTRATGVVGEPHRLGPVHVDPMPSGVTLSDPIDTETLLERASVEPSALMGLAGSDTLFAAGATAPVGTPGVASLGRHLAPSCSGTGVDGNRVQAMYVHQASTTSRYAQVLPILRNEIANVDDVFGVSAEQTGGQRRVRWVHSADCQPVIKDVTVPNGSLGSDFWATISALQRLGYQDPHRKYLLFADTNQFCGIGTVYDDARLTGNANDGSNASYARVDAGCWSSGHSVAAHELTHNLGGVLRAAPHATVNGHCFDESDLMCYDDGSGRPMQKTCGTAQEQLLDCNHDDYFNTAPAAGTFLARNWNTARSSFLDTVVATVPGPQVLVSSSAASMRTGQHLTLVATSPRTVSWAWARSASGSACTLTPGLSGRADLVCPSTVSGTVTVTATASEVGTAAQGSGQVDVAVSRAAAPTARTTAPTSGLAGTPFAVSVAATGTAPFGYQWSTGSCRAGSPTSGYTTVTCPAGSPTQILTISVMVTQADGQRVRATSAVQVTGGAGWGVPPAPAATAWSAFEPTAAGTMTSWFRDTTGASLSGRPVTLQARWAGSATWVDERALRTDYSGRASTTFAYPRAGWFRFAALDDTAFRGSTSSEVYVKVVTRLQVATSAARHLTGTLSAGSGAAVAGARVTLEQQAPGSTRWTPVTTLTTDGAGTVGHRVTPSLRTYYRWVFPGTTTHVGTTSPQLAVS